VDYTIYIKPELLILIPALCFFTEIVKSSFKLDHHRIPLIIGIASIFLSSVWVLAESDITHYRDVLMAVFIAIVQGLLCAGAAVYFYQVYKQSRKSSGGGGSDGSGDGEAKREMVGRD